MGSTGSPRSARPTALSGRFSGKTSRSCTNSTGKPSSSGPIHRIRDIKAALEIKKGNRMQTSTQKRKVADCRLFPSEKNCSLTISGTEDEVLTVAARHAVHEHGHADTPELKQQLREFLKDE